MDRYALLIASQTFGLQGCENDVALMARCLRGYDFEIETVQGKAATRMGILTAYRRLIEAATPRTAVVIFYSGHGALVTNSQLAEKEQHLRQVLIPADYSDKEGDDFCGILNLELSRYLAELTLQTDNVTLFFDCCHAARISRQGKQSRALPVQSKALSRHLENIKQAEIDRFRHFESNPLAVRLSAAGVYETAKEYRSSRYGYVGMFTEALADILEMARKHQPHDLTWSTVGMRIREWVSGMDPSQRPEWAGPCNRLLFKNIENNTVKGPVFFYDSPNPAVRKGTPSLRGGQLMDVQIGDVFAIVDPHSDQRLSLAEVTQVGAGLARVKVSAQTGVFSGAPTVLVRKVRRPCSVILHRVPENLRKTVIQSPFFEDL